MSVVRSILLSRVHIIAIIIHHHYHHHHHHNRPCHPCHPHHSHYNGLHHHDHHCTLRFKTCTSVSMFLASCSYPWSPRTGSGKPWCCWCSVARTEPESWLRMVVVVVVDLLKVFKGSPKQKKSIPGMSKGSTFFSEVKELENKGAKLCASVDFSNNTK